MIALLEDSSIKLSDSIDTGNGSYKFYNQTMRDHKPGGYGMISVRRAFELSSNIAISKLVNAQFGSDPQRYIDYITDFGLSQPLGFQMIGEGIPKSKTQPTNRGAASRFPGCLLDMKWSSLHCRFSPFTMQWPIMAG
jgi:cell division protein FtsI (penicillin-binding protein 3)